MWLERAHSLLGVCVILLVAWALGPRSTRGAVNARTVGGALLILFVFAWLVLKTPLNAAFMFANEVVDRLLGFTHEGADFVFGSLVSNDTNLGFIFAVQVLPTIIFFSALMSILYHFRILPWVVSMIGKGLSRALGVSGPEALATAADIFVGQAESPLVVRPYVDKMSPSEINACMIAGYATTAGGVLAAYIAMLSTSVPNIGAHLIAASVMGAPASLAVAKLMLPETTRGSNPDASTAPLPKLSVNLVDAITRGTIDGLGVALNVAAMVLVFLALTAMCDAIVGYVAALFGATLTLATILSWLFYPLAWVLGVSDGDVGKVAGLLGTKTVLNEFIAYSQLSATLQSQPDWLTERSKVIVSYALCGFANFGSIGIQVAAYTSVAPERGPLISALAFRAMVGGLLATCLIACMTGMIL
jgi:concentrative nucleoside transporter, CNT family